MKDRTIKVTSNSIDCPTLKLRVHKRKYHNVGTDSIPVIEEEETTTGFEAVTLTLFLILRYLSAVPIEENTFGPTIVQKPFEQIGIG